MSDDLLDEARRRAEKADLPVRAAAMLRIARAESARDVVRARKTLLEGLGLAGKLQGRERGHLIEEAREVAAAVDPGLLADIAVDPSIPRVRLGHSRVVQIMLAHGYVDAAFDYLVGYDDASSFPFLWVGGMLHKLNSEDPDGAARRTMLLRHVVEIWRRHPSGNQNHERDHFLQLFGHFWKELPTEEALAVAHSIVAEAAEKPDSGTMAGYMDQVRFTSPRQNDLFRILHILRHLDPALAQSLIDSNDQLAVAVRRYPNGEETIAEEVQAETERRKADGATRGGGYVSSGDPREFASQRRLMDATRSGDFEPSIEDAMEKYREDTEPSTRNYAPKEYWPSTGAFRTVFYQAGKRLGAETAKLLERIPDDDLRLFATIELAAALAGVPAPMSIRMKQPRPPNAPRFAGDRILSPERRGGGMTGPTMRSPKGELIRCPKCRFEPPANLRWGCQCGHRWNTFWTSGLCPACRFQWEVTACPKCGEMSEHRAWYVP